MEIVFLLILGTFVGMGVLIATSHQRQHTQKLLALTAIACSVCDSEQVDERGAGSYCCRNCGYDTDASYPDAVNIMVRRLQEIRIAQSCLDSSIREFNQSRFIVTHNHDRERKESGPFPDRYLEGMEQVEEALHILEDHVAHLPMLGAAIPLLGSIPPPPNGMYGFNDCVDQAIANIKQAQPSVLSARRPLIAELKKHLG